MTPLNPDLVDTFGRIGEPTDEFKPATGNLLAGLIAFGGLSFFFLAGLGFILLIAAEKAFGFRAIGDPSDPSWLRIIAAGVGLLGPLAVMLMLLRHTWRGWGARVFACPGGFVHFRRGHTRVFRWEDIQKVTQDYVDAKQDPPKDDGLTLTQGTTFLVTRCGSLDRPCIWHDLPLTRGTTFLVTRADGLEFSFGVNAIKGHRRFARWLFAETQARGIRWEMLASS